MPPIELQFAWSNRAIGLTQKSIEADEKKCAAAVHDAHLLLKRSVSVDDYIMDLKTFVRRLERDGYVDVIKKPHHSSDVRITHKINDPAVSNAYASLLARLCGYQRFRDNATVAVSNLPFEIRRLHTYNSRNNAMSFAHSENSYRASATMRKLDKGAQKAAVEDRAERLSSPDVL